MEILNFFVIFLVLVIIVFAPIFCASKRYSFVKSYLISTGLISFMLVIGAYWPELYRELQLDCMGFNFEGLNDAERTKDVLPEMRDEAKDLYWSNIGIGWPLKALIWIVILLPYPLVIFLLALGCRRLTITFKKIKT